MFQYDVVPECVTPVVRGKFIETKQHTIPGQIGFSSHDVIDKVISIRMQILEESFFFYEWFKDFHKISFLHLIVQYFASTLPPEQKRQGERLYHSCLESSNWASWINCSWFTTSTKTSTYMTFDYKHFMPELVAWRDLSVCCLTKRHFRSEIKKMIRFSYFLNHFL